MHPLAVGAEFFTLRPGRVPYRQALALQEELRAERQRSEEDVLLLLEHPPVVTLGRGADGSNLLLSRSELASRGLEVTECGRGGDVTYHGPGQLVGYPIVDLAPLGRDLHRYLRMLEELLIAVLKSYGLPGERVPGRTGVWVGGEKIASIGIGVRRWISCHGFALNVAADLSGFSTMVPCGLPGVSMTSLERLLGQSVPLVEVEERVVHAFAETFNSRHAGDYERSD